MNRDGALWTAILAGPIIWLTSFEALFALNPWACIFQTKAALYTVSVIALAGSAASGLLAWNQWKALGLEMPGDGGDRLARSRSMAFSGVILSTFCCLIIIAQAIPELVLESCQ
jgi:hypothetical protein